MVVMCVSFPVLWVSMSTRHASQCNCYHQPQSCKQARDCAEQARAALGDAEGFGEILDEYLGHVSFPLARNGCAWGVYGGA